MALTPVCLSSLQVRIFTYLIGREAAFADNLKWMACANKGFFTQISTLADVQENVMEYLHVLSRPKVIDQEHDVVWTEAYIDSTVSSWALGMKLGLTFISQLESFPVFISEKSNCIILPQLWGLMTSSTFGCTVCVVCLGKK
ncbi:Hypothetical predicted protein, partial [Marmota monax]